MKLLKSKIYTSAWYSGIRLQYLLNNECVKLTEIERKWNNLICSTLD